jgi:hypothetical protein
MWLLLALQYLPKMRPRQGHDFLPTGGLQQLANRKLLRDFTQRERARRTSQLVEDNGK